METDIVLAWISNILVLIAILSASVDFRLNGFRKEQLWLPFAWAFCLTINQVVIFGLN